MPGLAFVELQFDLVISSRLWSDSLACLTTVMSRAFLLVATVYNCCRVSDQFTNCWLNVLGRAFVADHVRLATIFLRNSHGLAPDSRQDSRAFQSATPPEKDFSLESYCTVMARMEAFLRRSKRGGYSVRRTPWTSPSCSTTPIALRWSCCVFSLTLNIFFTTFSHCSTTIRTVIGLGTSLYTGCVLNLSVVPLILKLPITALSLTQQIGWCSNFEWQTIDISDRSGRQITNTFLKNEK